MRRRERLSRDLVLWAGEEHDDRASRPERGPLLRGWMTLAGVRVDIEARGPEHLVPVSLWHRGRLWVGGMASAAFWLDGHPGPPGDDGPEAWAPLVLSWAPGDPLTRVNDPLAIASHPRARRAVRALYGALARVGRPDETAIRIAEYAAAIGKLAGRGERPTQRRVRETMGDRPDPAQMSRTVQDAGYRDWEEFVESRQRAQSH